ncbi:translation initiation factor IF-2 [Rickettsiales bacterium]|nr:translation initiation factor IF-2 [Rickettsiales bacterium]
MSDNEQGKKTLKLGSKLTLGGAKSDKIAQNIARNRGGHVQVEVKKKRRTLVMGAKSSVEQNKESQSSDSENKDASLEANLGGLTEEERNMRLKVLKEADSRRKEEDELRKEREKAEKIAQEKAEEEAKKAKAEEEKKEEDEDISEDVEDEDISKDLAKQPVVKPIKSTHERAKFESTPENANSQIKSKIKDKWSSEEQTKRPAVKREEPRRRSQKLTINEALSEREEKVRSMASVRRAREKARKARQVDNTPKEKVIREVVIPETITVQELANRMSERSVDAIKALMKMGMVVTANQTIDADTAELVVSEFGHNFRRVSESDVEDILSDNQNDNEADLEKRPPVVTFMGHVDHGKTSLLDAIRESKVASGEAGGITQHIGAYQVTVGGNEKITFLDTPGHEAFTEMRKRGAGATDIVVLVVAADDGIMAQTVEAINHAKAAEVPIIVAINKIDKPEANVDNIKNELLSHDLVPEDFGGDIMTVGVSAKTGEGLDKLLETILLQSEMMELQANPKSRATGIVVEARMDKTRGAVSTILVQKGTLRIGDIVVAGEAFGKIRAMTDAKGKKLSKAGPSVPVEILGLDSAPSAGSPAAAIETEKQAREIIEYRQKRDLNLKAASQKKSSLEELFEQAASGGIQEVPIVIKADVQGSVEAIIGSLEKLATEEVSVKILHTAVGGITSSDITLASASRALVVGFNVRADKTAREMAEKEAVSIQYYSIIYNLIDDVKAVMSGLLKPAIREQYIGSAEIREIFNMSKYGKVAGCYVTDGNIKRGSGVRLLRDNIVIHEGSLKTLRRFKDDVKEVGTNFECGMAFENYEDIKAGDVIEAFELVEEARSL